MFKGFKSPIPPAAPPSYGGRSNENEIISDDSSSKTNIRKKSSSATKSSVPRNNILRERLNFNNTPHQNLDPKKSPISSYSSDPDYEDQNSDVTTSSFKPYDPLTNYLSPRPKFLRYNPNRRREIFLHQENEVRELELEFDTQKSSVEDESSISSSQQDSVNFVGDMIEINEVEDDDDEEDEIEEFEEESDWFLRGALKFLLVVVTMFLSTLYISTMNSLAPSFSVDGNLKFQNISFNKYSTEILTGGNQTGLVELKMLVEDNIELLHTNDELGQNLEVHDQSIMPQIGQNEGVSDDEFEVITKIQDSAQFQGNETADNNSENFEDYPIAIYTPFVLEDKILEIRDEMGTVEDDVIEINPFYENEEPDAITKETEFKSIPIQIIGVSSVVAFVAFLGIVVQLKKVRSRVVTEKDIEIENVEREEIDRENKSSSLISPIHHSPNEMMMSYSTSMTSKIVEISEEESSTSNNSVSHEKNSTCCVSYGSFTAEKKILKKEKQRGKDGEVNMVITTPVRRSSRLLKRGLISP